MPDDLDNLGNKIKEQFDREKEAADKRFEVLLARRNKLKALDKLVSYAGPVIALIALLYFAASSYRRGYIEIVSGGPSNSTVSWPIVVAVIITVAGAMLFYLRDSGPAPNVRKLSDKVEDLEILLKSQPTLIKQEFGRIFDSDESRQEIISGIKDEIHRSAVDSALALLAQEDIEARRKLKFFEEIESEHIDTMGRLQAAISNLQTRANLNLVFGIILTGIGVSILWQTLSITLVGDSAWDFARAYFPRLSLVLIVELFSYFFLNLYKSNLSETRYYHNELTNISNRRISLVCALESSEQSILSPVVIELSKTERNNVLKKGQTTIEIEKDRIQSDSNKNLTSIIERLLQAAIPSKKE